MNTIAKVNLIDAVVQRKENRIIFNIEMVLERKKTGKIVVIHETDGKHFRNIQEMIG